MCLIIASDSGGEAYRLKEKPVPLVAEKPILVFKVSSEKQISRGEFTSLYFPRRYVRWEPSPEVKLDPIFYGKNESTDDREKHWEVEGGYHSYLGSDDFDDFRDFEDFLVTLKGKSRMGVFVIPEGSEYYLGTDNTAVSDRIIYIGRYADLENHLHVPWGRELLAEIGKKPSEKNKSLPGEKG